MKPIEQALRVTLVVGIAAALAAGLLDLAKPSAIGMSLTLAVLAGLSTYVSR